MATIKLADGRNELYQWDTGRKVVIDDESIKRVHYQNQFYGRTIDVDVSGGFAIIPDRLLQSCAPLVVFAWSGNPDDGYTKIEKTFEVNRRNKPSDYVFTPVDQKTLDDLQKQIGDLADLTTEAKENLVAAINEVARTGGGAGSMDLRVADGYIQYSADGGSTWQNLIAVADLKGADGAPGKDGPTGAPGKDGHSPVVTATKSGKTTTINADGAAIATVEDGADGKPGAAGADGITPTIGSNGHWYLGDTDTGKPSRGEQGPGAEVFYIDLAGEYPRYTCPVAMADIKAAYEAGKELKCRFAMGMYTAVLPLFLPMPSSNTWLFSGAGALSAMGFSAQTMTIAIVNGTVRVSDTRLASMDDIPTALKNPNALTIKIGGTTVTYDGSAVKTVTIADGTEVSY